MRSITTYLFCAVIVVAVFASCQQQNTIPSLQETFSFRDKKPFGAYVFHNQLQQLYSNNTIQDKKQHFSKTWQEISDTGSLYINISRNLILSKDDRDAMLSYVSAGNSMFIASEYIDEELLTDLRCTERWGRGAIDGWFLDMSYTAELLDSNMYNDIDRYSYYYLPFSNYFKFDTGYATILGRNENGDADYIIMYYGKGRFYLHCEPRAFSNYFLLQKENYHYLQNAFAFTKETPEHVFWDDFYNAHNIKGTDDGKSSLSFLLQFPSMAWAFWLSVVMLLLYILLGSKRRQRIIKVIPPNTNTTVAFTETVGRLYYQQKDNKNIADKMITYFLERIRNQYFLNTSQLNEAFMVSLSRKSSVPQDIVNGLFGTIATIQESEKINNQLLLLLNQQIENFYKNNL